MDGGRGFEESDGSFLQKKKWLFSHPELCSLRIYSNVAKRLRKSRKNWVRIPVITSRLSNLKPLSPYRIPISFPHHSHIRTLPSQSPTSTLLDGLSIPRPLIPPPSPSFLSPQSYPFHTPLSHPSWPRPPFFPLPYPALA